MKLFDVAVKDGSDTRFMEGFELQRKLWIVVYWIDMPDGKWTKPGRIIRFDHLRYGGSRLTGYVLNRPMPKALFDELAPPPPIAGHESLEEPNILIPIGRLGETLH